MEKSLVIIPTYNEKENIGSIILEIIALKQNFDILIVDDNSKDGTRQIIYKLQTIHDNVFILEREKKSGLGKAYIEGFKWALEKNIYACVFEIDADFSHNPKDLIRLHHACMHEGYDVAIGSRYIKGGNVKNWDKRRILISRTGSLYTQFITWMNIKDPTAGFICYKIHVLKKLNLENISASGYAFQIEMKFKCKKLGFKLVEVPITFIDRVRGTSKMNGNIVKEAMFSVLKMQVNYLLGNLKL